MQKKGDQKQLLLLVRHVTDTRFASAPSNHIVYRCHGPAADDVETHDLDLDLDCLAVAADPSTTGPRVAVRPMAADCSSAQLAQPDRNHSAQSCSRSRRSPDQDRTAVATTTAPLSVALVVQQRRLPPRPAPSRVQNLLAACEFPDAVLRARSPAAVGASNRIWNSKLAPPTQRC